MMALIAVAAVLLAAEKARRHWVLCREEARFFGDNERRYLEMAALSDEMFNRSGEKYEAYRAVTDPTSALLADHFKKRCNHFAAETEQCRETASRAARNKAQYARAMFRPWESIPPESH
jgi:hypothetical protein